MCVPVNICFCWRYKGSFLLNDSPRVGDLAGCASVGWTSQTSLYTSLGFPAKVNVVFAKGNASNTMHEGKGLPHAHTLWQCHHCTTSNPMNALHSPCPDPLDELTQIAQETFDGRVWAVNSRQHSVQTSMRYGYRVVGGGGVWHKASVVGGGGG